VAATCAKPAFAYKLYASKYQVHEQMTERSAECFIDSLRTGKPVQDCSSLALGNGLRHATDSQPVGDFRVEGVPATFGALTTAVRWPDDPQRKLVTLTGMANFGLAFEAAKYCRSYSGLGVQYAGLLCASHFGSMQFLHAMASDANETAGETQTKILEWSRFAYDYAIGRLQDDVGLCDALRSYPSIREALVGSDDSYICTGNDEYRPRTVGQLFGFQCRNIVSSAVCWIIPSTRDRRIAALGAILHVIQDSYSQAHAQRGGCSAGASVIRRQAVERFLNYAEQDSGKHAQADAWPIVDVVADPAIEHPIVAGAQVLSFFSKGADAGELANYLRQSVLGVPTASQEKAGPGECYIKEETFPQYEHLAARSYRNRQRNALE